MEKEEDLIFSFIIADATAFKKCIDVFKKLLEPIPFRITKNGIYVDQVVGDNLYNESIIKKKNLLSFYFDEKKASHPNFVVGINQTEASHNFSLDLRSIKSIITSITKKDHVRIYQFFGDGEININIHRDGYPERHTTRLKPLDMPIDHYNSSDQFIRTLDNPSCTVSASSLNDYLRKISKNQIKKCPMYCYPEGFIIKGSSDARHVRADFSHGKTEGKPLFVQELQERVINALKEMCAITPTGLIKFYIEPEGKKIVRISANITYLGVIILYILPNSDEGGLNKNFNSEKSSKKESLSIDYDSEENYSEEDDD